MQNYYNKLVDFQRRIFVVSGPYVVKMFILIFVMLLPVIVLAPIITRSMVHDASMVHDVSTNYIIQRKEAFMLPFEMLFFGLFARCLDTERFGVLLLLGFFTSSWAIIITSFFPPFKI